MKWHEWVKQQAVRLSGKLLAAFLLAAVLPFVVLSLTSIHLGESALKNMALAQLTSDLGVKEQALKTYLDHMRVNIGLQGGHSSGAREILRAFLEAGTDEFSYRMYNHRHRPYFRSLMNAFDGAERVILIASVVDRDEIVGKIVYADALGSTLTAYDRSGGSDAPGEKDALIAIMGDAYLRRRNPHPIARAYIRAIETKAPVMLDFQPLQSGHPASLWMAAPILAEEGLVGGLLNDQKEGAPASGEKDPLLSETLGVILLQVFPEGLNRILESGSAQKLYLVGRNESGAQVLRSDDDVLKPGQRMPAWLDGVLDRDGGASYHDSSGKSFLAAVTSLQNDDFEWN